MAKLKEKLRNVANVIKIAVTGKDLDGDKATIRANTSSKTLNKGLEVVANHPFITAGVVAGGVTLIKNAPAIATAVKSATLKTSTTSVATTVATTTAKGSIRTAVITGAVGVVAGSLIAGSGGASTAPQDVTQDQQTTASQPNTQTPTQDSRSWTDQRNYSRTYIEDSPGASVSQDPSSSVIPTQNATQSPSINQTPTQEATPTQTASSSGNNWLLIAVIGIGAFMLGNRR